VSAVAAAAALLRARRLSRRVARLSESYWELRYEPGQLNARIAHLEGSSDHAGKQAPAGVAAFVPLTSLKKN
jgi:hypothetical protein